MKESIVILLILFINICGCKTYNCKGDKEFDYEFKEKINIIRSQYKNEIVYVEEYRKAGLFLGRLTKHYPSSDMSSTIGYERKEDFKNDIKIWKDWYKKNKCKYTKPIVDSIINCKISN